MTDVDRAEFIQMALALAFAVIAWLGWWVSECRCDKCAFHRNERAGKAADRRSRAEKQRELGHDVEHKGFGYRPGDPDVKNCLDPDCARNRQR